MSRYSIRALAALAVLLLISVSITTAQEEEEKELGWFSSAELGLAMVSGNAESESWNLGLGVRREWEEARWLFGAGGLRAETTTKTQTAVGESPDEFTLFERSTTEKTAESYFVDTRYERTISENWYGFGSLGWLRNTFAGVDSRFDLVAGAGRAWVDSERTRLSTDFALSYTDQTDVVEDPSVSDSYAGLYFGADFWRLLSSNTEFVSQLAFNDSLSDTSDWRFSWLNSIQVAMSERLALKASLLLLYDNLPALGAIPLENPAGTPTGDTVLVPLEELDTFLTISLVANF